MTPSLPLVPLLPEPLFKSAPLNLAKGASVAIVKRGTAVHPTLYADEAGEHEYAGAVATDNFGRTRGGGAQLWVEIGRYTVTAAGQEFEWEAVTGDSVVLDEDGKLPEAQLPDSVVTSSGTLHSRSFLKYDGVDFIDVPDYVMRPAEHGAKEDGSTDDSAAINKCIEEAQEAQSTQNTTAIVELGQLHAVADTIVQKTAPLVGRHPWIDQLVWTGANGGIVIQKEMSFSYPASALSAIKGFAMVNDGVHTPATWINFGTESGPDSGMDLSWLRFEEASGPAVVLPNFVTQVNWEHLWFDAPCEYLIKIGVNPGRNRGLMTLDECQFSNVTSRPGNGKALIRVDNPEGLAFGTIKMSNGRIEMGRKLAAPHAIVSYNVGVLGDHTLKLIFEDMTYADVGGSTEDVLYSQEGTAGAPDISIRDCDFSAFSTLLSGTLPSPFPTFPGDNYKQLNITRAGGVGLRASSSNGRLLEVRRASVGVPISVFNNVDAFPRLEVPFGEIKMGEGSIAPDVTLERSTAKTLQTTRLAITEGMQTLASAETIAPRLDARVVTITGTAEIKKMTATKEGHVITLIFSSTAKLVKGENLKLASSFEATADDSITLACNGTNWYEAGRSVN